MSTNLEGNLYTYGGTSNIGTVRYTELPKQSYTLDPKKPTSQRKYIVRGSTNKLDIQIAVLGFSPAFDATYDTQTGAQITLFRGPIKIEEIGYGSWSADVSYESSSTTVELSFTLGVQTQKIQQALADVKSYSCLAASSADTTDKIELAHLAADALGPAATPVITERGNAQTATAAAIDAANAPAVDQVIKDLVILCSTQVFTGEVGACTAFLADAVSLAAAVTATAASGTASDATTAAANNALAQGYLALATLHYNQAQNWRNTAAQTEIAAIAALAALPGGGNAVTQAAVLAAGVVMNKANLLLAAMATMTLVFTAAADAAAALLAAMDADLVPGATTPNFNGAIGVGDGDVQGCDIEVGHVEFSITKHWSSGVLPSTYFVTLAEATDRTIVNDNAFTFIWFGQTLTFSRGTLRFRGAPIKWSSSGDIEITYHFAYSRPLVAADALRIGQSGVITKEGHEYLWVFYKSTVSAGRTILTPQSVHINKVYPYGNFANLQI